MELSRSSSDRVLLTTGYESHPYNHFGLGELPYLVLMRYARGSRDRERIVQLLREAPCKNSCTVSHLSGKFDLAIWVWVPAGKLDVVLELIRSPSGSPETDTAVFPIQRLHTPFQRSQDVDGVRATLFERHFGLKGGLWTPDERSNGLRAPELADKLKFYTIIETKPGESKRVFRSLIQDFEKGADKDFEHYTVCTYKTEIGEGCIITAYTTSWQRNEIALMRLLDDLPDGTHSNTYLCFRPQIDNDLPWLESRAKEAAPSLGSLKTRAMMAIAGTFCLRDRDIKSVIPTIEAWFSSDREDISRALLTYDPLYWWEFTADVRALIEDVVTGTGERFVDILLKRYIGLDQSLCASVRRLFALRKAPRDGAPSEREKDALILSGVGNVKFAENVALLEMAMRSLGACTGLDRETRQDLQGWIGKPLAYYKRLGEKAAHLPMGALGEIVSKINKQGLLPPTKYLNFEHNPLMTDWEKNLNAFARDRDLLAHGIARSSEELDENGQPHWEHLLPNYIRAVPQIRMLLRELERAFIERCENKPILLPLKSKKATAKAQRGPAKRQSPPK